jgi:hypothetical protein
MRHPDRRLTRRRRALYARGYGWDETCEDLVAIAVVALGLWLACRRSGER